jgi:hypothetical protein
MFSHKQLRPHLSPPEWFALLHTNAFVGLLLLNVFDLVNYILAALMYLGIYSFLRSNDKAYLGLAMVLTAIGTSVCERSNTIWLCQDEPNRGLRGRERRHGGLCSWPISLLCR